LHASAPEWVGGLKVRGYAACGDFLSGFMHRMGAIKMLYASFWCHLVADIVFGQSLSNFRYNPRPCF
jgi:hypothetical protein